MNKRYLTNACLYFTATVVLGVVTGLIFCTAHIDPSDCAMYGIPYLKACLLGFGGASFMLGVGGGAGLSARYVYTIIRKPDLDIEKYHEMIFDLAQLSVYALLGFSIFVLSF